MTLYNAVRGTKDVLPAETGKWQYVISRSAAVFKTFNYAEIITPIFEVTELFTRGIGETSDIVTKEMYTFPDKKGRSLTLRPEGTAGVVRAYLENKLFNGPSPVKLFYIGPMFRYERPQAGRYREHWQMGVEVFGSDSPALDAEVINTGLTLFSKLGVTGLKTNLNSIGCLNDNCRPAYIKALKTYLENSKEKLCETCKFRLEKNPLRILDCKEESCRSIFKEQGIPRILNFICPSCKEHFDKVKAHLGLLGAEYVLNENLVRGLDYYTKTVFEITCDKLGAQNTVLGGGRYNNLVKEFGGQETPAVGFSTGLERLMITLDTLGIKLPVNDSADVFLVHLGEEALKKVFVLADTLRKTGLKVALVYEDKNLKTQMKLADQLKARKCVIIGENELKEGLAVVKNMLTGEQVKVAFSGIETELKSKN